MDRMRFMAPALVAALGSDPENTIRTRCQTNGIPAHLRATAPAAQEDVQKTRRRGPDLREKLKEKSEVPSTSAIPADHTSNWDVQVVTEYQSNNNTENPPPLPVTVAFSSKDQRFSKGLRGKERDRMIAMVKNFGGWETQKKWELRAEDAELRLHLERKGVSSDLIRKSQ